MTTTTKNTAVLTVTDDNFQQDVLASSTPVLVDFWAEWCGPCQVIGPVIEELAAEYQGRVKVGKLNVDENPVTTSQLGVRSIPTLIFFKNGEIVDGVIGAMPKSELKKRLEALLD